MAFADASTLRQLADRAHVHAALQAGDRHLTDRLVRLATRPCLAPDDEAAAGTRPAAAFAIPGRIELIGKHVDYAGGRSLTCAVDRGFCVVATPRTDCRLVLHDVGRGQQATIPLATNLRGIISHAPTQDAGWTRYPQALVHRLVEDFPSFAACAGVTLAFDSDLPAAAGISSSSALVVAIWLPLAWAARRAGASLPPELEQPETLAGYLGAAESGRPFPIPARERAAPAGETHPGRGSQRGVGTLGGAQDHTAILCARQGCLLQARYAPERIERWLRPAAGLPPLRFVIQPSGVTAHKAGGAQEAYNRLANEAQAIAACWRQVSGDDSPTLGAALDAGAEPEALHRACRSDAALARRLEQFLSEEASVVAAGDALARGDLETFGTVIARSHTLAESHLGNQIPETSFLVRAAIDLGAQAASAFGAGFGGAVWTLVAPDRVPEFQTAWHARYAARFPEHLQPIADDEQTAGFVTSPGPPARRLV